MKNKSIILSLLLLAFVPLCGMEALQDPVEQAVKTAYKNPSVEKLEHLNLLLGQFPDNSKENQKLKQAIAQVAFILGKKPGICIEKTDTSAMPQQINIHLAKEGSSAGEFDTMEIHSDKLEVLHESITIKNMLDDMQECDPSQGINLISLTKQQFITILSYLEDIHYINQAEKNKLTTEMKGHLQRVGEKLCKESFEDLIALYKNANYLDIPLLLDLCCQAISIWLQEPDQLEAFKNDPDFCKNLNLPNDLKNKIVTFFVESIDFALSKCFFKNIPKKQFQSHNFRVRSLAFSGNYLATCSMDNTVCVYQVKDNTISFLQQLKDHKFPVNSVAFNGNYLATCSMDKTVCVYQVKDNTISFLQQLKDHNDEVNSVAFSGNYLATCSMDKTVCVYQVKDNTISFLQQLKDHTKNVYSVAFSGNYLATCSMDKTVCVYVLRKLQEADIFLKNNCSLEQALLLKLLLKNDLSLQLEKYSYLFELFVSLPKDIHRVCADCTNIILPISYRANRNFEGILEGILGGAAAIGKKALLVINWQKR